jgi:hypothetical protein
MADVPTFQPNPYANFDPSQWSNPYSQFYGKALPWPSSYAGMPTNALGQPIQPPPGMTLNSRPAAPAPAPAAPSSNSQWAFNNALINSMERQAADEGAAMQSGPGWAKPAWTGPTFADISNLRMANGPNPNATRAAAPPAPAAAPGQPSYDQVLSMLANPGPVTTPGATVPQAASGAQPGPGVLQSFLANWKPASSGPGAGFTQNFNTILRGLQAQRGS